MNDLNIEELDNNLTEDMWWLILYSLLTDTPEQYWKDFSHNLLYKNRFSYSGKIVDEIKKRAEVLTKTMEVGQTLYRARIYHNDPLKDFIDDLFKQIPDEDESNKIEVDSSDYYNMEMGALYMAAENNSDLYKTFVDSYRKWKLKHYKGYNSKESGIAPAEKVSAGRINPAKISYLYLTEDPQTCVYEVRPTIGQNVSVASFKVIDPITVYDMSGELVYKEKAGEELDSLILETIQKHFSEPNYGDEFGYLPTQYLSELIKQMGFDGVRYKSSLKKDGYDVVLFSDKKCKPIRSDIICIDEIELKTKNPLIYELDILNKVAETNNGDYD